MQNLSFSHIFQQNLSSISIFDKIQISIDLCLKTGFKKNRSISIKMLNRIKRLPRQSSQIFADETIEKEDSEDEVISAKQFDNSSEFFSIVNKYSDYCIRSRNTKISAIPSTSSSSKVDEKINEILLLRKHGKLLRIVSANAKSIKLWTLSVRTLKKIKKLEIFVKKEVILPQIISFILMIQEFICGILKRRAQLSELWTSIIVMEKNSSQIRNITRFQIIC